MDHLLQLKASSNAMHIAKVEQNLLAAASALATHNVLHQVTEPSGLQSRDIRCPELLCRLEVLFEQKKITRHVIVSASLGVRGS